MKHASVLLSTSGEGHLFSHCFWMLTQQTPNTHHRPNTRPFKNIPPNTHKHIVNPHVFPIHNGECSKKPVLLGVSFFEMLASEPWLCGVFLFGLVIEKTHPRTLRLEAQLSAALRSSSRKRWRRGLGNSGGISPKVPAIGLR